VRFLCGGRPPASPAPDTLGKIVDDYWRHELDDNVASQIKFGIPTHHLPDVSYAHAQWNAEFAQSCSASIDSTPPD